MSRLNGRYIPVDPDELGNAANLVIGRNEEYTAARDRLWRHKPIRSILDGISDTDILPSHRKIARKVVDEIP